MLQGVFFSECVGNPNFATNNNPKKQKKKHLYSVISGFIRLNVNSTITYNLRNHPLQAIQATVWNEQIKICLLNNVNDYLNVSLACTRCQVALQVFTNNKNFDPFNSSLLLKPHNLISTY